MTNKSLTRQEAAQLLGVSMTATPLQIRKAFRRLAKSFHPDVNPSDKAKEQFILLQEAQRILLEPRSYDKFAPPKQNYDGWMHRSQQVARDFSKRYVDPVDVKVNDAIEPFFLGLLRVVSLALVSANLFLWHSEILFNPAWIFANIVSLGVLYLSRKLSWKRFWQASQVLLINPVFLIIFFFVVTILLFWSIGMRTFIPLPIQVLALFGTPLALVIFNYRKDKLETLTARQFLYSISLGFVFNLMLLFNFLFAKPYFKGLWSWRYHQLISAKNWTVPSKNKQIDTRLKTKIESYSRLRSYDMPIVLKKGLLADCMEY